MNIYSTIYSTFHLYNPLNNILVANMKVYMFNVYCE